MKIHIVQKGESLKKIAKKYNVSLKALQEANAHIMDAEDILAGVKIRIPTKKVALKKKGRKTTKSNGSFQAASGTDKAFNWEDEEEFIAENDEREASAADNEAFEFEGALKGSEASGLREEAVEEEKEEKEEEKEKEKEEELKDEELKDEENELYHQEAKDPYEAYPPAQGSFYPMPQGYYQPGFPQAGFYTHPASHAAPNPWQPFQPFFGQYALPAGFSPYGAAQPFQPILPPQSLMPVYHSPMFQDWMQWEDDEEEEEF